MIKHINSLSDFREAISGSKILVVDFYADWCGPCKKISPKYEELAIKYPAVGFYKINSGSDSSDIENIVNVCEITSLPSFVFFIDGQYFTKVIGANEKELEAVLSKTISNQIPVERLTTSNTSQFYS